MSALATPALTIQSSDAEPDRQAGERKRIPSDWITRADLPSCNRTTLHEIRGGLERCGDARLGPDGEWYFNPKNPRVGKWLNREAGIADPAWTAAPLERQREALARCRFVESVDREAAKLVSQVGRKEACRRACRELGQKLLGRVIPLPTFYDWDRKYRASGRRRSSLVDMRGLTGPDHKGIDGPYRAHFESIYLTEQRRGIRGCWRETEALAQKHGWRSMSYPALRRWVKKTWPAQKADRYRLGERAWRAKYEPKMVFDVRDLPGNHTWCIDHLRLDFWARVGKQRVRLWCTLITDRASNLIVGWAITTNPSSDSLAQALRRAVTTYGASLEVVLDNGRDMAAYSFGGRAKWLDETWVQGVFDQLGVKIHFCDPFSPWAKGQVEGMARTIHEGVCKTFWSYCGRSTQNKPQDIDKECRERFNELPGREEVEQRLSVFVETQNERPSDAVGVAPLSPRQRFEQTRIAVRTLPADQLDLILLPITGPRKVTAKGVMHRGLYYAADRLFDRHGQQVRLRYNPDDISYVWVCEMNGKPLFVARQNYVTGTAEDVRVAAARRKYARNAVKEGRMQECAALDDTPTAILRAQIERYRQETAKYEPPTPPIETLSPIVTPAADAVRNAAETIRREETRAKALKHTPRSRQGLQRFTVEEINGGAEPAEEPAGDSESMMTAFLEGGGEDDVQMDLPSESLMNEFLRDRDVQNCESKAG